MIPPDELSLKSAADVPVESLVRLVRSYEKNITGVAFCTEEDILLETGRPGHGENSWCLVGPGSEVVARAALTVWGDTADCVLTVLPGRYAEGWARSLLLHLMDRADELAALHGTRYRLRVSGVLAGDEVVPAVLERSGFERRSVFGQYDVGLTQPSPPAALPGDARVRRADPSADLAVLHTLHLRARTTSPKHQDPAAFRDHLLLLYDVSGFALLLESRGHPVGYVLVQAGHGEGRVLEVVEAPAFRGLGLGVALITASLAELRALGCVRALITLDASEVADPDELDRVCAVQGRRTVTDYVATAT